jgi:hypothetical protein
MDATFPLAKTSKRRNDTVAISGGRRSFGLAIMLATAVLTCALLGGCTSAFGPPRSYLTPTKYQYVQQLYAKTNSLQIVQLTLEKERWRRSQINEALYRLEKENEIIIGPDRGGRLDPDIIEKGR